MLIYPWDDRRTLWIPGNEQETISYAAHRWIESAQAAIAKEGRFIVALSGGSTPKKIFQKLVEQYRNTLPWDRVFLFWSDERSVPPSSIESNFHMAWIDADLRSLPIREVHRMVAEENLTEQSHAYETLIHSLLGDQGFDLIMLGMGDDGHTASLFPKTKALQETTRWVVENEVPQHATWRMTFTYPLIHRANEICIYVLGRNKAARVSTVLNSQDPSLPYPAQAIGTRSHPASWILDQEAASQLSLHE